MDTIYQGAAIFSTHLGKFEPRNTVPPSIVLRTNPNDDQDEMVARLRRTFPQECKLIKAPITNVAYYFDGYEMHQYGFFFLRSVLETIARHNWNRAQNVQGFADQWIKANPDLLDRIMSMSFASFSMTAHHSHGAEFGREVFGLLQSHRASRSSASKSWSLLSQPPLICCQLDPRLNLHIRVRQTEPPHDPHSAMRRPRQAQIPAYHRRTLRHLTVVRTNFLRNLHRAVQHYNLAQPHRSHR